MKKKGKIKRSKLHAERPNSHRYLLGLGQDLHYPKETGRVPFSLH